MGEGGVVEVVPTADVDVVMLRSSSCLAQYFTAPLRSLLPLSVLLLPCPACVLLSVPTTTNKGVASCLSSRISLLLTEDGRTISMVPLLAFHFVSTYVCPDNK